MDKAHTVSSRVARTPNGPSRRDKRTREARLGPGARLREKGRRAAGHLRARDTQKRASSAEDKTSGWLVQGPRWAGRRDPAEP